MSADDRSPRVRSASAPQEARIPRRGRKLALCTLLVPALASADNPPPTVNDVEVPSVIIETGETTTQGTDEALDLANIVQSAAKGVTTVQEAPAIVTVVTSDDIRDRQYQDLLQLVDNVPGWSRVGIYHSTFPNPLVRGQAQAVQFLHDGVSLFDPFVNVPTINRAQPMELIKRVEMITGPGGVLWGSNSLLGILNVITKDAEDVEGVEMGATVGNGPGDRLMSRAYAMAGKSDLLGGKLKLFAHGSVETYQGPDLELPQLFYHGPLPQPNSANSYGPPLSATESQSYIVTLDGKLTYEKFQLRAFVPFAHMYKPFGFSGEPVRNTCKSGDPIDPTCAANTNRSDTFDRYVVGEYRTRFANDKAGITARVYGQQFVRNFQPLQVLAPSALLNGGLDFSTDLTSYRAGGAIDGDIEAARQFRILYGAEAFREWENGPKSNFAAPDNLSLLPILCPRIFSPSAGMVVPVPGCTLDFAYAEDRTVLGAYIDPQLRPNKQLIFDAGARLQVAPSSLGSLSYPVKATFAGGVVWNFIPNWHLKLNYTQGFRPPVFNNTASNGEGVQIGGNTNLLVETSDAAQAEVNARIFKGDRRIRELTFRADASYTRLKNLIQVNAGAYANSGERGIASAEFLGRLYVQGGHHIDFGYTWLRIADNAKGQLRSLPEHWFDLATVFALGGNITATTNLKVTGAAEDPNRMVDTNGLRYDAMGNIINTQGTGANPISVNATDLVLDRIPSMADLSIGLTWMPKPKIAVRATIYDALWGHYYQPDVFFDYEPHLEYLPNPFEGFRAYLSALVQY